MTNLESVIGLIRNGTDERIIAEIVHSLIIGQALTREEFVDVIQHLASEHYMRGMDAGAERALEYDYEA